MLSVASSNPTLLQDVFACWWLPCGVTWDAVPEQLWLLKLQWNPTLSKESRADKTLTTCWSGGRVQVWVQVRAPGWHLAIKGFDSLVHQNDNLGQQQQWWYGDVLCLKMLALLCQRVSIRDGVPGAKSYSYFGKACSISEQGAACRGLVALPLQARRRGRSAWLAQAYLSKHHRRASGWDQTINAKSPFQRWANQNFPSDWQDFSHSNFKAIFYGLRLSV